MCFGPSRREQEAANDQRREADIQQREVVEKRAERKVEDIEEAIDSRQKRRGTRAGSGRRSLFRSGDGGFLGRFG